MVKRNQIAKELEDRKYLPRIVPNKRKKLLDKYPQIEYNEE